MNSILNNQNNLLKKNLKNFKKRFPQLASVLEELLAQTTNNPADTSIFTAKNGEFTAYYQNILLHSAYNPSAEAQKLASQQRLQAADNIVFYGFGLGYAPVICSAKYPNKTLIFIEPDLERLLWAFSFLDWTRVLEMQSCVFLAAAPLQTAIAVLENFGLQNSAFISQKNWMNHQSRYFADLQTLIERNIDKQNINERTLERFSKLWLSNICKNLEFIANLDGINRYKDKAGGLSACILAAGPHLDTTLPHLAEIKKRCIIICVDTALRACLSVGVQPHFIVLVDPQYWNARHLDRLAAPESILITESAAYPSVFRFVCREIILCSSLFPIGKYIETFTGVNGELAAGGSVAASAWDFARFIGCKTIFMAGLDLGFPDKKTHARHSTFEENAHNDSNKLKTVETKTASILYSGATYYKTDYTGNPLLTDDRMKLYAWWFESKCTAYSDINTLSLSAGSLAVPGISAYSPADILNMPPMEKTISFFCFSSAKTAPEDNSAAKRKDALNEALASLSAELKNLNDIIEHGLSICKKNCTADKDYSLALKELNRIDALIRQNKGSLIVSLMFPPPRRLEKLINEKFPKKIPDSLQDSYAQAALQNILKSQLVYQSILTSINMHRDYLCRHTTFFKKNY